MNDGIAMLIDRMKTNPEEFFGERDGKWENLVYKFQQYLDPSDIEVFKAEVGKLMRQRFTEKVIKELIDPKFDTNPYLVPSAGAITLTSGNVTLATPIAGVTQTI